MNDITPDNLLTLPTAASEPVKQDKRRGRRPSNVVAFRRPEPKPKPSIVVQYEAAAVLERASRDLHTAATIALRLSAMVRDGLGFERI